MLSNIRPLPIFIAGYPVWETTQDELATHIYERFNASQKTVLLFANTNFTVKCRFLLSRLMTNDVVIVNDGVGMDIACRMMHGHKFKSNLNGTDFTPYFLSQSKQPLRVFLVGGSEASLNGAAYYIVHTLGHMVVGSCDGFDGIKKTTNLIDVINESAADVVLVALGNPRQEEWILMNYEKINAQFFSGVGALFDFWSGDKPRAPQWIQEIHMEWFYRLSLEPKRLFKRYTIDILRFLFDCVRYRKLGAK
jgi:beta-1,4-glucosyltransferase